MLNTNPKARVTHLYKALALRLPKAGCGVAVGAVKAAVRAGR
jgi:hypothetical protein